MRLDQVQRHMSEHGFPHAVAIHLDFEHLDWISKDTDMQAAHWQKHTLSWEVPEGPFDFDAWAKDIADKLKDEAAYTEYQPTIGAESKGKIMFYGYRYHNNPQADSGWNVVFEYTYIDPELALM